jgi:hypothetical protein
LRPYKFTCQHIPMFRYVALVALTVLLPFGLRADNSPASQPVVKLDSRNNGQHFAVKVGDRIELWLGMVGPSHYGDPRISSAAVRLISQTLPHPPPPGGAFYTYVFEAAAEGVARIRFPVEQAHFVNAAGQPVPDRPPGGLPFTVTIRVRKS